MQSKSTSTTDKCYRCGNVGKYRLMRTCKSVALGCLCDKCFERHKVAEEI